MHMRQIDSQESQVVVDGYTPTGIFRMVDQDGNQTDTMEANNCYRHQQQFAKFSIEKTEFLIPLPGVGLQNAVMEDFVPTVKWVDLPN